MEYKSKQQQKDCIVRMIEWIFQGQFWESMLC